MRFNYAVRKVLQRYWRLTRGLTLGVRAAVLDSEGRVLLVRHTYAPGWHFPGGGVEFGETVHSALGRELKEEAGISIEGTAPEPFGLYLNHQHFPGDHVVLFVVRTWQQTHTFTPNREIAEARFYARDALPETTASTTRYRLEEIAGERQKTPHW